MHIRLTHLTHTNGSSRAAAFGDGCGGQSDRSLEDLYQVLEIDWLAEQTGSVTLKIVCRTSDTHQNGDVCHPSSKSAHDERTHSAGLASRRACSSIHYARVQNDSPPNPQCHFAAKQTNVCAEIQGGSRTRLECEARAVNSCDLFFYGRRLTTHQALAQCIRLSIEIDCHAGHINPAG